MRQNASTNLLYPPFTLLMLRGFAEAEAQGIHAYPFECWRSMERQAYLFAQGRSTLGKIVTWVQPGLSLHQYGVAFDAVFKANEGDVLVPSWEHDYADAHGDEYARLAPIMKAQGLEWLGDKNVERAHFQKSYGLTVAEMQSITKARGILGLWEVFDSKGGAKCVV